MTKAKIPLSVAALAIPTDRTSLRRALNRFSIVEYDDDGQRIVDESIAMLFHCSKKKSGYLYPRDINTRDRLLAAAAELA